jgi:hypothetical protein
MSSRSGKADSTGFNSNSDPNNINARFILVRPLFLGNLLPNYSVHEIFELLRRHMNTLENADVEKIDMNRNFCIVHFHPATSVEEKKRLESLYASIRNE